MATKPTSATTTAVDERDLFSCVRCGRSLFSLSGSRHHRKLRRSNDHSIANLILLCGSGTSECHGWVHAHPLLSYQAGWLIQMHNSPTDVPVRSSQGWRLLDTKGSYDIMTEYEALERMRSLGVID